MIKRGDIYYISRDYNEEGTEERLGRPGIIVSSQDINERGYSAIVVLLTSKELSKSPAHCQIADTNGRPAIALCDKLREVAASRIGDFIGTVSDEDMARVDFCIAQALGLSVSDELPEEDDEEEAAEECYLTDYSTEEIAGLTAELKVYKELYENLLDRLIGD